jgi:hypothetical protein
MRLLAIFSVLLSAAASLTLHKTDGTTIELGDEPMVVDLSNVIMPALAPVTDSNIHNTPHVANTADWDHSACNVSTRYHLLSNSLTTTALCLGARQLQRLPYHCLPVYRGHKRLHELNK